MNYMNFKSDKKRDYIPDYKKYKPYIRCDQCAYSTTTDKKPEHVLCLKYNMLSHRDKTCKAARK